MLNQTDLSRIDLNLLVLFEAVFAERHVGRAAKRLHVSASAVSHGLGRLRDLLHDPLFLRHPKGVVPTSRAESLAAPIAAILAQTRSVIAGAEAFDPATAHRRFMLGAPDGASAVLLPPLLASIRRKAQGIDLGLRNLVGNFDEALRQLDERQLDVAVIPYATPPARFTSRELYPEDFVLVMRKGHALGPRPSLKRYCAALHVVVSMSGDPHGNVDRVLAEQRLARRVVLTVPNFMLGLAVVAQSDLVAAMPRTFVAMHRARFGVTQAELPLALVNLPIYAITPRAANDDLGLAWLLEQLTETAQATYGAPRRR